MQSPTNLGSHQVWGGEISRYGESTTDVDERDRTFVLRGRQEPRIRPSSRVGFIASNSDDLFHPAPGGPSHTFHLPPVPVPSRHYAYNHPINTSYNNPSFSPPPLTSPTVYRTPHNIHDRDPLGPPPPLPPRLNRPLSVSPRIHTNIHHPQQARIAPAQDFLHPPTCHSHCHSHTSSSTIKTLPTVTHIPLLTSKTDFFAWDEGVTTLLRANGLLGHILDPSEPMDLSRPDRMASPPPVLPHHALREEIAQFNSWWDRDNIAQHILVSRLGNIPRGLLPSPNIATRTALSIYKMLSQYYGTSNFTDCAEILTSLQNLTCTSGRVVDYVSKWRTGISRLQSARFIYNVKLCINYFVRGLPLISAFTFIRATLSTRLEGTSELDLGLFIKLTEEVLELDTVFRSASQFLGPRSGRSTVQSSTPPSSSTAVPTSTADPAPHPAKQGLTCGNCKSRGLRCTGHTDLTCFQPGGGMEGRREEYLSNKGRFHAMFVECLDNASLSLDPPHPSDSPPPALSPTLPSTLDDDVILAPLANLCVPTFPANSDFDFSLYSSCAHVPLPAPTSRLAFPAVDFTTTALSSVMSLYNALLDSGCTHHIIRDRALFSTYLASPVSVGTANCGTLQALGTGDVKFRYPYRDRHVLFTLRGCLYAPSAPIHLLSVGALVERGMSCLFSPGGITKVFFPDDHLSLPGLEFLATVVNRLSFLKLVFAPPSGSLDHSPTAFPACTVPADTPAPSSSPFSFPRLKLDSMLWHRRFGHLGMEATRAALTKNYVTGVHFEGPFLTDRCIACIVGKSPQRSYSSNGNRAVKVGELLHMDLCGPYPVQAPRGERHFFNILDDKTNFGFTFGLRLKSDAFSHYLATEAFLERSHGISVLSIRCGGELELTAGKMGAHLASKGIVVQRTVAYAHEQNGKSERYIRTLEEGGQALLAGSGLPSSFWLDAVLTGQYLCNRLPTSTLPNDITPFESFTNGRKPDLSHLRVWGCDCYVAIPDELRPKAGFKHFQAIFVGYEEHRKGWRVRDLHGKYSFSNDVIFNENLSGRLGVPRPVPSSSTTVSPRSPSPRLPRVTPRVCTAAGRAFDSEILLRDSRTAKAGRVSLVESAADGGAMGVVGVVDDALVHGGAVDVVDDALVHGGAVGVVAVASAHGGAVGHALVNGDDVVAQNGFSGSGSRCAEASSLVVPDGLATQSLETMEMAVLESHCCPASWSDFSECDDLHSPPTAFAVSNSSFSFHRPFDLTKFPLSYSEAIARSDASVWRAAMDRERKSLEEMGAFEEVVLPKGERTIGLKWVFDHKTDAAGVNIPGKEKARLVAQGFNQRPGQFGETYAPVAKMASIRILLAWAAVHDLDIFQFDCKTAFLHAKIRHPIYVRQIPGYPLSDPLKVLRVLGAHNL